MAQQDLRDYQWKQRILLLIAPDTNMAALKSQVEMVQMKETAFKERDVLIFLVGPKGVYDLDHATVSMNPTEVYSDTDTKQTFSGVVLIGKDGGVKLRRDFVVAPQTVLELIDGMPMRRAEIRKHR